MALQSTEIAEIIERFGICAAAVKDAGFTGVQVHAAHGYLLSQFLSPRTNQRTDNYGGTLENRARLLMEVVAKVRESVGNDFPVAVKLNSADFQKGGFAFEDSLQVVQWLEQASVDLIEISGGTYEQPKLLGVEGKEAAEPQAVRQSTRIREAYFVDFALAMQEKVNIPLMVTGGFRHRDVMEQTLLSGSADLVGIGRPMCVMVDAPARLLSGSEALPRFEDRLQMWPDWLSFLDRSQALRTLGTFGIQYWYYAQLDWLGHTGEAKPDMSVFAATRQVMTQQRRWLSARKR